jgi:hypothetical protein
MSFWRSSTFVTAAFPPNEGQQDIDKTLSGSG